MLGRLFGKGGGRPEPPPAPPATARATAPPAVLRLVPEPPPPPPKPDPGHRVYTAHRTSGEIWGRCLCGAVLRNESELDAHRRLYLDVRPPV